MINFFHSVSIRILSNLKMILQKIFEPIMCFSATKLPGGVYFNHESPLKKGQKNNLNVIENFVVKFYEKIPTIL